MNKNFLEIDPLKLDDEWLRQSKLYMEYAERSANARRELDNARNYLEIILAEQDQYVRKHPKKLKLGDKITESLISAVVNQRESVKKARQAVIDASYEVNVCGSAVTALEHKKRALTMLVELHTQNYFSEPSRSASSRVNEEMEKSKGKKLASRTIGRLKRDDDKDGHDD